MKGSELRSITVLAILAAACYAMLLQSWLGERIGASGAAAVGSAVLLIACMLAFKLLPELIETCNTSFHSTGFGVGVGVAAFVLAMAAYTLNTVVIGLTAPETATAIMASSALGFVCTVVLVLSAAVAEELLFRGIIYRFLEEQMSPRPALLISSFVFAAYHLSLFQFLPTLILGGLLGMAYHHRGLWAAIVAHGLFNALGVSLAAFAGSG